MRSRAIALALLVALAFGETACREESRRAAPRSTSSARQLSAPSSLPTSTSPPPVTSPPPAPATPPAPAAKSTCTRALVADAGDVVVSASCAATQRHVYCVDRRGNVERRGRGGDAGQIVGAAIAGTPIAAADFGEHEIAVFLAARKTSEGTMLQAFASIDGAAPVRVSEDGTGATSVDVAPRGASAVVAYVDARGAMTPVHARVVSARTGAAVELGRDAVIFVGGAPDPHVAGALGTADDAAFFVLPMARDTSSFGMAIVTIDDPPRDDEPVTWAMYPYGLDPAPIAVTRGKSPIRVARVVPRAGGLHAPRAVELGTIDRAGAYRSLGVVVERDTVTHVSLAVEPQGTLLLTHADGEDAMTERLRCGP